jgi:hypothetical protein
MGARANAAGDDVPDVAEDEVYFVPSPASRFNPWIAALASRRVPYRVEYDGAERRIAVPAGYAEKAGEELAAYERINHAWPRQAPADPRANEPLVSDASFFAALASAAALFRFTCGWKTRRGLAGASVAHGGIRLLPLASGGEC